MKVRYRNVVTREQRDIERHSPEENLLLEQVTSVGGESRPLWMTEDDYQTEQTEVAEAKRQAEASEAVTFGANRQRLTPGEVEMGIDSYDQKARELGRSELDSELDAALDELPDEEEEDDEPEGGAPAPPAAATTTATRPRPRSGQARRPPRRASRKPGSK